MGAGGCPRGGRARGGRARGQRGRGWVRRHRTYHHSATPSADRDRRGHDQGGQPQAAHHGLPVRAGQVAGHGQGGGPRHAADRGVQAEPDPVHPGDPGGQRDERAHHRQQAADQHRPRAVPDEPPGGAVQLTVTDPEPAAPAVHRGRPAVPARGPGQVAAHHVARGPGHDHADQVQRGAGHRAGRQRAAERHDQLGRHRDARRLGHHEHEDGEVAVGGDEVLHQRARVRKATLARPTIRQYTPKGVSVLVRR